MKVLKDRGIGCADPREQQNRTGEKGGLRKSPLEQVPASKTRRTEELFESLSQV